MERSMKNSRSILWKFMHQYYIKTLVMMWRECFLKLYIYRADCWKLCGQHLAWPFCGFMCLERERVDWIFHEDVYESMKN